MYTFISVTILPLNQLCETTSASRVDQCSEVANGSRYVAIACMHVPSISVCVVHRGCACFGVVASATVSGSGNPCRTRQAPHCCISRPLLYI